MEFLHPGVYIQEVPSGVRPIEGVSTSTAAFLGQSEMGPDGAVLVTSFTEFERNFGRFLIGSYLAYSALRFFDNGGRRLYIVRVTNGAKVAFIKHREDSPGPDTDRGDDNDPNAAPPPDGIPNRKGSEEKAIAVEASSKGAWGGELEVEIKDGAADPDSEFTFIVRRVRGNVIVETETFADLSMDGASPNFVGNLVNARSRLVHVAANDHASDEKGSSISGPAPEEKIPANREFVLTLSVNGDADQSVTLTGPLDKADDIASGIEAKVTKLKPIRQTVEPTAYSGFTAAFAAGRYTLTSGASGKRSAVVVRPGGGDDLAPLLKLGRHHQGIERSGAAVLRPKVGTYFLTEGDNGATPAPADYTAALNTLDSITDVNIIAVPGIGSADVVESGSSYCQTRGDCFFVGDMPLHVGDDPQEPLDTSTEAREYVDGLAVKSSYGALYFPWLKATDPTGVSADPIELPPSGYVCGMYARIDARRGVWKAPAGTEANLAGAVGLVTSVGDAGQDILNPIGVNVIRFFPASGIVIWGARTLATRSDPEYRYVPVRRLAIFLEQSIYNGVQWAVFEPNDEDLWASLRLNIGAFMMNLFRAGAFQGNTPSKAFFVKCDPETNPQEQIDAGIVTVLVGFAPLKPAEFVVIKISQKTATAA